VDLQTSRINAESAKIDVLTAKSQLLPTVSGSVSQRLVNRPFASSSTIINGDNISTTSNKTSYNGSYGINANWTVFNGGQNTNNVKQQKLNSQIAELDLAASENSVVEQIVKYYVQILYAAEAVKINQETCEVNEAEYKRGKQMFDAGSISKADLAQLESQLSSAQYQVVSSETSLENYKMQLKQLLQMGVGEELDLYVPILSDDKAMEAIPDKMDVYYAALGQRPEIESSKLNVDNQDLNVKIAKGGYYPTVSLNASSSTTNINGTDYSFGNQLKDNWSNGVGVTLSVPIFSNRQTKSAVEKAKLQKTLSQIEYEDAQMDLYREIETIWLDAKSAQQRFVSALTSVKSANTSFELMEEKFNLGMKNFVELLTEKNNLLSAQQEKLQAKYMAILNMELLKFYKGESMNL